ncbi:hypothetical protein MMC14_007856 [Varicellaria rhodocarpa]|nr:hypothetical protein [Varicellaria rhodocarpa]
MADRSMSIMSEKTDDLDLQSPPMFHSELFVEWFFQINTYISPENRTDGDNSNKRTATGNILRRHQYSCEGKPKKDRLFICTELGCTKGYTLNWTELRKTDPVGSTVIGSEIITKLRYQLAFWISAASVEKPSQGFSKVVDLLLLFHFVRVHDGSLHSERVG